MNIFGETQVNLSKDIILNFLNIENYSNELFELIEKEIGYIRNGDLSTDELRYVKLKIKNWLAGKKDMRAKIGFVSEFICHLYLRHNKFEQYSLFKNLEEKGPKKGFDALYVFDDRMWIVESKSTSDLKKTHCNKIQEAYKDLKNKIEKTTGGEKENDPWENAKNHLDNRNIKENLSLCKSVKKLSEDFVDKIEHKIDEFNVITCSTIYLNSQWKLIDNDELEKLLSELLKAYTAKKIQVICVNKKCIDDFIKFIES